MKNFKFAVLILITCLVFVPGAWGQDLDAHLKNANEAYKNKNYQGAIDELSKALAILKDGGNPAGAQQIQMNIGVNYIKLEKYEEAVKALEEAAGLYKKPDPKIDFKLNQTLATAHYNLGHYALRASILEGLLNKYGKQLDDKTKANLLAQLADSYRRNEIHSKAILYYGQALALYEKLGEKEKQAVINTATGLSQSKLGDFPGALKSLNDALVIAESLENKQNLAETYSNIGIVNWDQGEYVTALDFIRKAKDVEGKNNLKRNLGADFNNEGLVYKSVGDYYKALDAIEQSISIAREINDLRSEAIALSNRALIYRIQGQNEKARKDYLAALDIYEKETFLEGTASCYLGLGKLYEVHDLNYQKAYEYYEKALDLYKKLGNLTYQAETLNQMGRILRNGIDPARTSRDLIFEEDEPQFLQMSPEEAKEKSLAAYNEALILAEKVNKKEAIWSAQQGIGFTLRAQGKNEEALKYYQKAVDMVVSIKGGSDSELMANYLNDKEDLFTEAIELLSDLYEKTKNPEYRRLMMQYQEIYKNEVMKVAMNGVNFQFEDDEKASMYDQLKKAMAQKEKLDDLSSRQQIAMEQKPESDLEKAELERKKKDLVQENKTVTVKAKKLDGTIAQLLKEWKQKYPSDSGMFDSSAKIDAKQIQKAIQPDQALIQYFPLKDKLSILLITQKDIKGADVPISYVDLSSLIRDKFTYDNIELYGHMKTDRTEEESFKYCNETLHELYNILIKPIEADIADKKRLVIVPSKYVSYVPFSALVSKFEGDEPHYLVYDKTVAYVRLSFFSRIYAAGKNTAFSENAMLAVGNPAHRDLKVALTDLPAAENEVKQAVKVAESNNFKKVDALYKDEASEITWKEMTRQTPYSIFYFATHGVPYAEIMYDRKATIEPNIEKYKKRVETAEDEAKKAKYEKTLNALEGFENFCKENFRSKSPLNGFLYMSYNGEKDQNGVLTLKEIMEIPDSAFKQANLAVLSACNTGVTYSPKIDPKIRKETESSEVNKELLSAGWTPGVDQVCLTDTFMKRNFKSVLGTLWFADDKATGFIISHFFENLEKNPPAEALRQAKLAYLKNPPMGPDYTKTPRHPYYWAVSAIFGE